LSKIIKQDAPSEHTSWQWNVVRQGIPAGVQPFQMPRMSFQTSSTGQTQPAGARFAAVPAAAPPSEMEQARKQAFQEGYAEGERGAAQQAEQRQRAALDALADMVKELASFKPRLRGEAERELVALAFAISRRVLRRELNIDSQTVLAIVRTCLDEFKRLEIHRLRVNPRDFELVAAHMRADSSQPVEVVADPLVSPGGAVFSTSQGELDGRIETQLEEIEHGLADR
jgi:flagellar biosynthesis/type III secretory pathway protein FliH